MNKIFIWIIWVLLVSILSQTINNFKYDILLKISQKNIPFSLIVGEILNFFPFLFGALILQFTQLEKYKRKIWILSGLLGLLYSLYFKFIYFFSQQIYFTQKEIPWIINSYLSLGYFLTYFLLGWLMGVLIGLVTKKIVFLPIFGLCYIIWFELLSGYNRTEKYDIIQNKKMILYRNFISIEKSKILMHFLKDKILIFEFGIFLAIIMLIIVKKIFIKKKTV